MNQNTNKTHCKSGHEFDIDNTIYTKMGHRRCRQCARLWCKRADRKRVGRLRYYPNGKRSHLYLYKLTLDELNRLKQEQNFSCKACGKPTEQLQIDHDHKCCVGPATCGKCIRGLLCGSCNKILGFARDSIEHLELLIKYLKANM